MKKIIRFGMALSICISFIGKGTAQTIYKNYQDGKIWFKLKDGYGMKYIQTPQRKSYIKQAVAQLKIKGTANTTNSKKSSTNPYNIPFSKLSFIEKLSGKYHFTNLSKPFFAAKTSKILQETYLIKFSDYSDVNAIIDAIESTGAVDYAEKVPLDHTFLTPNDPSYSSQWYLSTINASQAWNYSTGSHSIIVATVDNAIDTDHVDLRANIWTNPGEIPNNGIDDDGNGYVDDVHGYDVGDNDNDPTPPNSSFEHGTHVSGLEGAVGNNSTGIASIGFGITIMPVKSTKNSYGSSSVTNGFDGIVYAAANGARVINCSWGGTGSSTTEQNVINYAWNQGAIICCAAGNDGNSTLHYPAAYNHVFCVAATNSSDQLASFSCYGSWIDICSPGVNIYSTLPGNQYGNLSGTSMATPIVSGLCGLMLSLNPAMTQNDVINCIESTAVNINAQNPGHSGDLGSGRIDAAAAMACASSTLNNPPVALFTGAPTIVAAGGTVQYTDQSLYTPTSWSWTFPGGTPSSSTLQNPTVTYNTIGTYNAKLVATNSHGSDTLIKTNYITVTSASQCDTVTATLANDTAYYYYTSNPPTRHYIGGENQYGITKWATYSPASLYSPNTYLQNAVFYFAKAHGFSSTDSVIFEVWDTTGTGGSPGNVVAGSRTAIAMSQIESDVQGGYLTAVNFANPIAIPTTGGFYVGYTIPTDTIDTLALVYTQNLTGSPGRYNTSYLFYSPTWYDFPTAGFNPMDAFVWLDVTTLPVTANITPSNVTLCQDSTLALSASTSVNASTYKWYFNGSSINDSSTVVNPSVFFDQAGIHTEYLLAYNSCGMRDVSAINVTIDSSPNVVITAGADTICNGSSTTLTGSGATSYAWSNGIPSGAGPHTISPTSTTSYNVLGTNSFGCSAVANKTVYVRDLATASSSFTPTSGICPGDPVNFSSSGSTNVTSYSWTFTGGNPATSTSANPTVNFSSSGTHNYQLIVTNSCGSDTSNGTVTVNSCAPTLVANFSADATSICAGDSITFTDQSTGSPTSWNWTFTGGNPSSATGQGPHTVTYTNSGIYDVKLIVFDGTTHDTLLFTNYITVNAIPNVFASAANSTICNGSSTTISASGANTYSWDNSVGNGAGPHTISPTSTTTYTVTGTSSAGCVNTSSVTVTVDNPVTANATFSPSSGICPGNPVNFDGSGSTNATSYNWSFTGGTPSSSTTPTQNVTYASFGTKPYQLIASNAGCGADTASGTVIVNNCTGVVANFMVDNDTICKKGCINFMDMSTNNPTTWAWSFPGSATPSSTVQNPGPICYPTPGIYDVTLIASNGTSSDTVTYYNYIVVDTCLGINNISIPKLLKAFYDASSKNATVIFNNIAQGQYHLSIINSIGQYVVNDDINVAQSLQQKSYDMQNYSKGVYIIRLIGNHNQYDVKFVKY